MQNNSLNHIVNYIAIAGFASKCAKHNIPLITDVCRQAVEGGYGISAGNLSGTFLYAFRETKKRHGHTMAIVESGVAHIHHQHCDILQIVSSNHQKHQMLAQKCVGAIVIGGGHGTKRLIDQFLIQQKPVVALTASGGIVEHELNKRVTMADSSVNILDRLLGIPEGIEIRIAASR